MARTNSASPAGSQPLLVRGGLYSQQQVTALLGVSKDTLQRWHQAGLQKLQPGTKQVFYFADDIFEVIQKPIPAIERQRP